MALTTKSAAASGDIDRNFEKEQCDFLVERRGGRYDIATGMRE
jgi:hypothetical protein